MYRYFIQPQLDKFNNSLIGYEMLIRYRETDQDRGPYQKASIIFRSMYKSAY
ncbi:protein containing diguanylatecyclase/phosphodiesterase domain 2 [Lactiplantibacillus plantarum]|nr:protein containing diguanylatecyclase/phosphodiesterase domain 2 [Lactiplantibacillus plantarum]